MERDKMEIRKVSELKEAVKYLEGFLVAMKKGDIKIEQDGSEMILKPAALVEIEVSAKSKKGKEKFSLEISWRTEQGPEEDMVISALPEGGKSAAEPSSPYKKDEPAAKQAKDKPAVSTESKSAGDASTPTKTAEKPAAKPAAKAGPNAGGK